MYFYINIFYDNTFLSQCSSHSFSTDPCSVVSCFKSIRTLICPSVHPLARSICKFIYLFYISIHLPINPFIHVSCLNVDAEARAFVSPLVLRFMHANSPFEIVIVYLEEINYRHSKERRHVALPVEYIFNTITVRA